jgi:hypothetical protein
VCLFLYINAVKIKTFSCVHVSFSLLTHVLLTQFLSILFLNFTNSVTFCTPYASGYLIRHKCLCLLRSVSPVGKNIMTSGLLFCRP